MNENAVKQETRETTASRSSSLKFGKSIRQKFARVRWILLSAAALCIAAVATYDIPAWVGVAGFCVVLLATGLSGRRNLSLARSAARVAGAPSHWPDTGMKMVVDALPDPCFLVDRRGITRYANPAARDRFGKVRPGDPLSFKLRPPALLEALDRVSSGGGSERIEWSEKVPTELWMEAHIAPVQAFAPDKPRNGSGFIIVTVRDLTEQRRLERMRADFVANASHELRTPLASLTGFIETLLGPAREDPQARERFLSIMLEQAGRMKRLIDDLLSLSRIELKAHVQPDTLVDLRDVIEHNAESLKPLADELGVELALDLPPGEILVRGDKDELTEVFENLTENALKYGASGKRLDIAARADAEMRGTEWWAISIRDYGPGIEAEHLPRLTERFYRVDVATSREMKGTGLGLAIVKHILTRHRARLEIESTGGQGACFTVKISKADRYKADAETEKPHQINS
ncbi:two-component sensor histidine kinase [Rhizobiales bacterium]|uniref:ATP-binding protein n=1 Tax=Hongsoonwoonella zoysiae TaxID=2821844 RepID=UPI00155F77A5|nr:ATP-binding protein [Hongsoonwoonella zoysiae]NRG19664.1 two-component sensor histidine kinase [Hongsoonwoonella zoysiae]